MYSFFGGAVVYWEDLIVRKWHIKRPKEFWDRNILKCHQWQIKLLVKMFQDNLNWFQSTLNFTVQFQVIYRVPSVVSKVLAQFNQNRYLGGFGWRYKSKMCPKKLDHWFCWKGTSLHHKAGKLWLNDRCCNNHTVLFYCVTFLLLFVFIS